LWQLILEPDEIACVLAAQEQHHAARLQAGAQKFPGKRKRRTSA
jgi:hypothetical protein